MKRIILYLVLAMVLVLGITAHGISSSFIDMETARGTVSVETDWEPVELMDRALSGGTEEHDSCPDDPDKTEPGDCGCGVPDTDTDGDGIADCLDQCPDDPDKTEPGDS